MPIFSTIKNIKPRKNSKYHQGVLDPKRFSKYYASCSSQPIIYRSGLELRFLEYCENNSNIVKFASEPIAISYFNRLKNKECNYFPDYICELKNGERIIIEVKPYEQTLKPDANSNEWLKKTWIQNIDKWTAAKNFALKHGYKFIIVTEKFF